SKSASASSTLPPFSFRCIGVCQNVERDSHVRFGSKADILQCGRNWHYSITSSARDSSDCGTERPSTFAVCGTIFDAKLQAGPWRQRPHLWKWMGYPEDTQSNHWSRIHSSW